MKLRRLYFYLALGWLLLLPVSDALADLVVVVNARNGVAVMTRNEVINIFFGRYRQFFNGVEAQPVDLVDSNPERARFYAGLVGKDISDVNAYWSRLIFSGRVQAPPRVTSAEEVLKWVSSHPGGIGFVELSKADARVRVVYELNP